MLKPSKLDAAEAEASAYVCRVEFRSLHRTALGTIKSVLLD